MPILKRQLNLFIIAFFIFWIVFTLIIISGLIRTSRLTAVEGELFSASASYRKTPGWKNYQPPHWELDVVYTYRFNGVLYEGTRFRPDGNGMVLESIAASKANQLMFADKHITVWVSPTNPKYAVLERKISLVAWSGWGIILAITCLLYFISPRKDIS